MYRRKQDHLEVRRQGRYVSHTILQCLLLLTTGPAQNTTPFILQMLSRTTCLPRNSTYDLQRKKIVVLSLCVASLGPVDADTVVKVDVVVTDEEKARQGRMEQRPPLTEILNLHDFEVWRSSSRTCICSSDVPHVGYRAPGDAREGVGVLQLGGRRRDYHP